MLTVWLRPVAKLLPGSLITIQGLTGLDNGAKEGMRVTARDGLATNANIKADLESWVQSTGVAVFKVEMSMLVLTDYYFTVWVRNGQAEQEPPLTISIQVPKPASDLRL